MILPVLAALIAAGYTRPPRGVSDAETDWIVAAVLGGGGYLILTLLIERMPTMTGLWRVDNLFPSLWAGAASIVVFSARHVLRMWPLWVFLFLTAPVAVYMAVTAALGGTENDAVLVAALLGTVAVFLSARVAPWSWRLSATGVCLMLGCGIDQISRLLTNSLLLRIVLVAGLVPLATVLVVHQLVHVAGRQRFSKLQTRFPRRRPWSYPTLALISFLLLWTALHTPPRPQIPQAQADWTAQLQLRPTAHYEFISRFVGVGATLTRYRFPADRDEQGVAIDVMFAPNLARLTDYSAAVWYPSAAPVNYRAIGTGFPVAAESLRSGTANLADGDQAADWYLVTWTWKVPGGYQRVTLIMDQTVPAQEPPAPRPLTLGNSLIGPSIWLARQQPDSESSIPADAARVIEAVTRRVLIAGSPR
ncbi:hypothetical protein BayCH28_06865 [Mycolicibacterium sp. CH28]|uniref:hypothetical protein n=1 Tax=Mycolicibacterium sp. CH28 TaxID=2512237 RepID=UPI00107FF492|nr:hypothetical protein [Mycolicibacterium sp. CH28]TGD89084.1 hypothetical protein BayCH28_06865 [Mycolicibacterium sp. CH28]